MDAMCSKTPNYGNVIKNKVSTYPLLVQERTMEGHFHIMPVIVNPCKVWETTLNFIPFPA